MIQTNEYALSISEHLKILMLLDLRKNWWVYIFSISIGIINFNHIGKAEPLPFIIGFLGFFYPIGTFIYLLNYVNSSENKNMYLKRQFVFERDKITVSTDAETIFDIPTKSEFGANRIIKKVELNKFWLFYIAKSQFLMIPKSVFKSEVNYIEFTRIYGI